MIDTGTAILILIGSFVFFLLIGTEICYALGLSALITCLYVGIDPQAIFQTMIGKVSNTSLCPFLSLF